MSTQTNSIDHQLSKLFAITTDDNPYDPIDQVAEWYLFDIGKGYCTAEKLARCARIDDTMSTAEFNAERLRAIHWLIANDPFVQYKIVLKDKEKLS